MAIKFGRPIEMREAPRRQAALAAPALDLTTRPRRTGNPNGRAGWSGKRPHRGRPDWPLFVVDGHNQRTAVASMPGVDRLSVDQRCARPSAREARPPCIALFPYTEPRCATSTVPKRSTGQSRLQHGARHQAGVSRPRRALRRRPRPFTSHGMTAYRDGASSTTRRSRAGTPGAGAGEAGCDIIAPSDMMDGRVGAIRRRSTPPVSRRADHVLCGEICPASTDRSATPSARRRR